MTWEAGRCGTQMHNLRYNSVHLWLKGWMQPIFVLINALNAVPGRNACEIKMFHQEDAGLNAEMAKLFFAKGIWSYICKMDSALRKYSPVGYPQCSSITTAVTLMQRVPPDLDATTMISDNTLDPSSISVLGNQGTEMGGKAVSRRPSKKMIANGLLLLGGVICLSRGHSSLSAKIAMACILKKLINNHGAGSNRGGPN